MRRRDFVEFHSNKKLFKFPQKIRELNLEFPSYLRLKFQIAKKPSISESKLYVTNQVY